MKRFQLIFTLMIVAVMTVTFSSSSYADNAEVSLHIEGMICIVCPSIIKAALEELDGVHSARVSFKTKRGEVSFDPSMMSKARIVKKISEIGFKAEVIEEQKQACY
ncbi:metal-binding (seleno)protein [Thermodesulfobacteriota bacterium]